MGMPMGRTAAGVLIVATMLAFVSCSSTSNTNDSTGTTVAPGTTAGPGYPGFNDPTDPFYQAPDPLPAGRPGDIIRQQAFPGAPAGAQAWLVLYHSTAIDGRDIAVSGVIIAPTAPAPAHGRPIVSWAHPTTGVVDACAPSTQRTFWDLIPGLAQFLAAGYVVAATDYEGLGTNGVHPYLVGISEGRGVLDAARAARNIPAAGAGPQLLLWGHSQGGQASLFAGELAGAYSPELDLVAVAAAAPAGELGELLELQQDDPIGVILGAYAMNAYVAVYGPAHPGMALEQVVTPAGQQVVPQLVPLCDLTQSTQMVAIAQPVVGQFFVPDAAEQQPWGDLLDQNTPGRQKTPAPMFIAQGTADTVVIPSTTLELAGSLCALGNQLQLKLYDGVSHTTIGYTSAPDVATWMASMLAGSQQTVTCGPNLPTLPPGTSAPTTTAA